MRIRGLSETKERTILSLACIVLVAIWVWGLIPRPPVLVVTFLSVGEGDAIVIQTPSGRTALVDSGPGPTPRSDFDAGDKVVTPFLRREGVNTLDALIFTHQHDDHIGGASSVIRNFGVKTIFDSSIDRPIGRYREVLQELEEKGVRHRRLRFGQTVDFHDGVTIEVLNPTNQAAEPTNDSEINDASLVLRVKYGSTALLLEGDAGKDAEAGMLSRCPRLSAQVLKVAHHGSADSSTTEWLAAVRPQIAIVSAGWKNQFGHPSPATVARLRDAGAQIYRTDEQGGIIVTTDGRKITVATSR
jgi:competence protein ComEC